MKSTAASAKPQRRCRRRSATASTPPSDRIYVQPTDKDVLRGRGGRTNKHEGNQRLLEIVRPLERDYAELRRGQKWRKSREIVEIVLGWGGRFLGKEVDCHGKELFFEMNKEDAIKLVEQKFRDEPNKRKALIKRRSKADTQTNTKDDDDDESFLDFVRSTEMCRASVEPTAPGDTGFGSNQSDPMDVLEFGITTDAYSDINQDGKVLRVNCVSPSHSLEESVDSDEELENDNPTSEDLIDCCIQTTGDYYFEVCQEFAAVAFGTGEGLPIDLYEDFSSESDLEILCDPYAWGNPSPTCEVLDPGPFLTNDQLYEMCLGGGDDLFA